MAVLPVVDTGTLPRYRASTPDCGEPLPVRAVRNLLDAGCIDTVVVLTAEPVEAEAMLAVHDVPIGRVRVQRSPAEWAGCVVDGSSPDPAPPDVVLVHDPGRALTPAAVIASVVTAVRAGAAAAVPALAVTDTVKRLGPDGTVTSTVDRGALRHIQAPWGFLATDLLRSRSEPPHLVPGHPAAMRITTPLELAVAESVTTEVLS